MELIKDENNIMEKTAVIIACFYSYSFSTRLQYFQRVLENLGYKCIFLVSDFDHRMKKEYRIEKENIVLIHTKPYIKNLSVKRMISHYDFAYKAFKETKKLNPDLVYVGSPPNSIVSFFGKYKKKFPESKVILSVSDMWPETFPISLSLKKVLSPFFSIWATFRNRSLKKYDGILFECDLFKQYLKPFYSDIPVNTVYMSKQDSLCYGEELCIKKEYIEDIVSFVYVGSINNIVDVDLIIKLLEKINKKKKVILNIIGGGEKEENLINSCNQYGIEVVCHGILYDNNEKEKILSKCQYGLNIMKTTVFVGATMKSLEYLYFGLPMVNNIMGDTNQIINEYGCGFNIDTKNIDSVVEKICDITIDEYKKLSENARKVFLKNFSENSVNNKIRTSIEQIINR